MDVTALLLFFSIAAVRTRFAAVHIRSLRPHVLRGLIGGSSHVMQHRGLVGPGPRVILAIIPPTRNLIIQDLVPLGWITGAQLSASSA